MKKIFLVIIIFIFVLFVVDINNFDNKMYDKITKENVYVDEIYIYGRYFNIKGHADFNLDDAFLIFVDSAFNETKYDLSVSENKFYLSDKINGGLNLEDIKHDSSTILLMSNDKYYPLINNSNYENTDYYTISNFNKTVIPTTIIPTKILVVIWVINKTKPISKEPKIPTPTAKSKKPGPPEQLTKAILFLS